MLHSRMDNGTNQSEDAMRPVCSQPVSGLPAQLTVTQRGPVYKAVRHSTAHTLLSHRWKHPIITSMFPCLCPTFSFQYSQKILLTRQLAGTFNQVVKSPKLGLYGQRQTSWHTEAPKPPEVIIEILFAKAKVLGDNDPYAGSPMEALLQILLPLSATAQSSFHQQGSVNCQASRSSFSLKHSIGSIWLLAGITR